jgi:hypothetical protein
MSKGGRPKARKPAGIYNYEWSEEEYRLLFRPRWSRRQPLPVAHRPKGGLMRLAMADAEVVGASPTTGLGLWKEDLKKLPTTPIYNHLLFNNEKNPGSGYTPESTIDAAIIREVMIFWQLRQKRKNLLNVICTYVRRLSC